VDSSAARRADGYERTTDRGVRRHGFAGLATFRRIPVIGGRIRAQRGPVLAMALACAAAPFANAQRLIVVSSSDSPANTRVIAGMQKLPGWTIEPMRIGKPDSTQLAALSGAAAGTAIVALGARAAQYVAQSRSAVPTIDCMVQGDLPGTMTAPVVPLAIPIDTQISWMRRLLPAARKVAILFDPAQNARTVADATRQLVAAGYTVMAEPVLSPEGLPPALAKIGNADVLLAIPDLTVYAPELAKGLLLFMYRTNTPIIATTDAWVRAGALYSLEWDYAKLGGYCAELAVRLVAPARNAAEPSMPVPQVSVNRRAAAQLHVKWDAASLADVDHVHD
jgi:putative tryptophan/tyrosine transport system substrate-binding protein